MIISNSSNMFCNYTEHQKKLITWLDDTRKIHCMNINRLSIMDVYKLLYGVAQKECNDFDP